MTHLNPKQKKIALIGGGIVVLLLLYRYLHGRSTTGGATTAAQTDPNAGAGSTMPGTGAGSGGGSFGTDTTGGQNTADISALTAGLGATNAGLASLAGQEQSDVAALTASEAANGSALGQLQATLDQLVIQPIQQQIIPGTNPKDPHHHRDVAAGAKQHHRSSRDHGAGAAKDHRGAPKKRRTASQVAADAAKANGHVNHNYHPHRAGSSVAPVHHGVPPTKIAIPATHSPEHHPRVVVPSRHKKDPGRAGDRPKHVPILAGPLSPRLPSILPRPRPAPPKLPPVGYGVRNPAYYQLPPKPKPKPKAKAKR